MLNFDPPVAQRSWASRRRLFVVLGVAALVMVPTVGSTLAGSISINSNNSVEFGQGTVMTTGCDNSITITPTSTYETNTSVFVLSDITVSGVNDTTCAGVFLMIKMYDSGGTVLPLCASDDGLFVLLDTTFATDVSSSCAAIASADSTGFVYQLDQLVAAESVNSLSIESSGTSTNATTTTTATTTVAPTVYSVGDPGPGGGIIFYKDLNRPVGSQYFEAACAGWQHNCVSGYADPQAEWGCGEIRFYGADGTIIGNGELNTAFILAGCATSDTAARLASHYVNSDETDWFLPSKDELNQMYAERASVGGFSTASYWSSSELDPGSAWYQDFYGGDPDYDTKVYKFYVRPVRAF